MVFLEEKHIMSEEQVEQYNWQDKLMPKVISFLKRKMNTKDVVQADRNSDLNKATDLFINGKPTALRMYVTTENKNQYRNLTFRTKGWGSTTEIQKIKNIYYYVFIWVDKKTNKPLNYIILDCHNNNLYNILINKKTEAKLIHNSDGKTSFLAIEPYWFKNIIISTNLNNYLKLRHLPGHIPGTSMNVIKKEC